MTPEILDTYDAFEAVWREAEPLTVGKQLLAWSSQYLAVRPDLREKLVSDYAARGLDWRDVAAERIFPDLSERLPLMAEARANLRKHLIPTVGKVRAVLGFEADVLFVIHVDIGCSDGWVTTFRGKPAVLFGLENIAEVYWTSAETIQRLIAHELGHGRRLGGICSRREREDLVWRGRVDELDVSVGDRHQIQKTHCLSLGSGLHS